MKTRRRHDVHDLGGASIVLLVVTMMGLLVLLFCTTIVLGKFRVIFGDLLEGRSLPIITRVFLSIPASVYVVAIVSTGVGLIWKEVHILEKNVTVVVNMVAFAITVVICIVLTIALFLPLIVDIQGIAQ